ncbi:MAG: PaaI family thioesterase [Acidimicrobiales bacterium]|nr:PaaI family thioesterase [Acidimicrobiales bacterium]
MTEIDEEMTAMARGSMPFAAALELSIISASKDVVVGTAPWSADRTTVAGALHGGCLMALADSVGAMCAFLNLPDGAGTSTIESKTNFFRSLTDGNADITATLVHGGRRTIVVQTDIARSDGKLVSRTTQTQAVLA